MEPKFVVKTTLNVDTQLEASQAAGGRFSRILTLVLLGISVVLFGVMTYLYVSGREKKNLFILILLVFAIGYLVYNQFFAPKRALRRWESNIRANYGVTEIHLTTEFYELTLAQSTDISDEVLEECYSSVTGFRETKHLFLLQCRHQKWFFMDKNVFTVGSPEEFRAFFSEKVS